MSSKRTLWNSILSCARSLWGEAGGLQVPVTLGHKALHVSKRINKRTQMCFSKWPLLSPHSFSARYEVMERCLRRSSVCRSAFRVCVRRCTSWRQRGTRGETAAESQSYQWQRCFQCVVLIQRVLMVKPPTEPGKYSLKTSIVCIRFIRRGLVAKVFWGVLQNKNYSELFFFSLLHKNDF